MEKPLRYFRFNIFIAITLVMLNCTLQGREEFLSEKSARRNTYLKIWVHSDIQPRKKSERRHYETSIRDIRSNIKDIDIAIVAGDIVQRRTRF